MKNDPPNTPDDQLDDLFRKAASGFEPQFDPEAWKRMEQKLDGDRYFQTKLKRFTLIEGIVILTMMALFWLSSQAVLQSNNQVVTANQDTLIKQVPSTLPNPLPRSSNSIESSSMNTQEAAHSIPDNQSMITPDIVEKPARQTEKSIHHQKTATKNQRVRQAFSPAISLNKSGNTRSASDKLASNTYPETMASQPILSIIENPVDTNVATELSPLKSTLWQKLPVDLSWQTPELESATDAPIQVLPGRWSLQLMLSPDFTQVPGRQAATGYNTGLQLEYRFAQRWRASAGVIYSLKNYSASSYDYRPYKGYWATYARPDVIDAACRMLDVPLTLTYDVWKWKQNQFFVSLGSTSYLMLKEDYYYQYPTYAYELEKKRTGNHWLATANISLGVERPILPRLLVRIEPFVKTPLGGVGFGNVRLRSSGVFFSLRYQLKKP